MTGRSGHRKSCEGPGWTGEQLRQGFRLARVRPVGRLELSVCFFLCSVRLTREAAQRTAGSKHHIGDSRPVVCSTSTAAGQQTSFGWATTLTLLIY